MTRSNWLTSWRVGYFLASRSLKRSSRWTNLLIIFVMTLTFLNLVVVSGILLGLVEGSAINFREQYSGDLFVEPLSAKRYIERSPEILGSLKNQPEVRAVSGRYTSAARMEANYRSKIRQSDITDQVGGTAVGIDPENENLTTKLSRLVDKGQYLEYGDEGKILVGSGLLAEYSRGVPGQNTVDGVDVGSKVRIVIGDVWREVEVKGIIKSKVGDLSRRIYFTDTELRKLLNRTDYGLGEIAVLLSPGAKPENVKNALLASGFGESANIETWEEAQGEFFRDLSSTFVLLGGLIGFIGLVGASITVFIVIFINAITRRKYIGILKGIGIKKEAIEMSYILQSVYYAFFGSLIGLGMLYGILKPYFDANPIDFPFSDGILVADLYGTFVRVGLLIAATICAGYIPAKMVIRKNTLDAILGR